jgi:predicted transcriptional regulator
MTEKQTKEKQSKIEKYGFQDEVLKLSRQPGMTGEKIGELLTARLDKRDTISQSTVSRYLTKVRKERQEQTAEILQEHLKEHIPADLAQIEEVQTLYYTIFRNQQNLDKPAIVDAEGKAECFDLKTRCEAGLKLTDIIFRKLKHTGEKLPGDDEGEGEQGGFESVPAGPGIRGIVRSLKQAGFTGPGAEKKESNSEGSAGVLS